jgi:NAD-dependent DNA ligase
MIVTKEQSSYWEGCTYQEVENNLLAHRYLYYVLAEPVMSDYTYDMAENEARTFLPEYSVIHGVGSPLASSYSKEVVAIAEGMLN